MCKAKLHFHSANHPTTIDPTLYGQSIGNNLKIPALDEVAVATVSFSTYLGASDNNLTVGEESQGGHTPRPIDDEGALITLITI